MPGGRRMRFQELELAGAFRIEPEPKADERGFFARTWCRDEFAIRGICCEWVQCNISFNRRRGTLRGLHYQAEPWAEAKLIRCTMGAVFDVVVDLRPASPTHGRWAAVELTAANRRMLFVPEGFAHGFQTLADETELFYQMSQQYRPEAARGVRWDDPGLAIPWPECRERIISAADRCFPELAACTGS
jgi:dTDP-4-dehydrorhamnose 3,5-epimerase